MSERAILEETSPATIAAIETLLLERHDAEEGATVGRSPKGAALLNKLRGNRGR